MFISLLIVLELIVFNLGTFLVIRKRCDSISVSFVYASILVLATLSLSIQAIFILGLPDLHPFLDTAIIAFSLFEIIKNRDSLKKDLHLVYRFVKGEKLIIFFLLPVLAYLFLQAFLLPPGNLDSMVYNLARVLMFNHEGSLFVENYSFFVQASSPVGFDLLSFFFLRFNTDFGLASFSFISYLIIVASTFSLVRFVFNRKLGVRIAIIIASLTEIVLQATTTKNDIPAAMAAIVIFLAGYHILNNRKSLHFYILTVTLLWGITIKGYFAGFVVPFVLIYAAFLIINWKGKVSLKEVLNLLFMKEIKTGYIYYVIPLGLILCTVLFYGNNIKKYGSMLGEKRHVEQHQNQDGVPGALVNMGRYIAQAAEIPIKYGYKLNQIHNGLLKARKSIGMRDKKLKIDLAGKPFVSEDHSWFGPLGFFLALPAVFFALFFSKGYVRMVSLSLLAYFVVLSYKVAWMPWNNRFFSLFFAGSGLCIAYVFDRFLDRDHRIKKAVRVFIVFIAIYGLLSTTLQNEQKPTIPRYGSANLFYNLYKLGSRGHKGRKSKNKCLAWISSLSDRQDYYKRFYPGQLLDIFLSSVDRDKNVLVMGYYIPVFPLLFTRPDLNITVTKLGLVSIDDKVYRLFKKPDYLFVREKYDYIIFLTKDIKKFSIYKYIRDEEQLFYSKKGSIFKFKTK